MAKLADQISDRELKYVITCRNAKGDDDVTYKLLWRASGKGGKPLPHLGQQLTNGDIALIVERIEPPGSEFEGTHTLLVQRLSL